MRRRGDRWRSLLPCAFAASTLSLAACVPPTLLPGTLPMEPVAADRRGAATFSGGFTTQWLMGNGFDLRLTRQVTSDVRLGGDVTVAASRNMPYGLARGLFVATVPGAPVAFSGALGVGGVGDRNAFANTYVPGALFSGDAALRIACARGASFEIWCAVGGGALLTLDSRGPGWTYWADAHVGGLARVSRNVDLGLDLGLWLPFTPGLTLFVRWTSDRPQPAPRPAPPPMLPALMPSSPADATPEQGSVQIGTPELAPVRTEP